MSALSDLDTYGLTPAEAAGHDLDPACIIWDRLDRDVDTDVPVVALADDLSGAREALAYGARGVLARDGHVERLIAAAAAVSVGLMIVDPRFEALLAVEPGPPTPVELDEPLTPRETEVLELLAEGLSNRVLANRLAISEHTAKFHVNAILFKLGANTRTEAVVRAVRLGLLTL